MAPSTRMPSNTQRGAQGAVPQPAARGQDVTRQAISARAQPPQRVPTYTVRPPIPSSAGRQRIQVMLQGSATPVGSVDIQPTRTGQAEIINLNVLQEHRRRGVARLLIDAALQNAQRQGLTGARLEARPSDSSISLSSLVTMYQKMGFRGAGVSSRGNPVLERRTGPV
ncbi:MAG TPA: GNAT family N-acetyltransferase [Candidatus Tectomicrobia bacterium]